MLLTYAEKERGTETSGVRSVPAIKWILGLPPQRRCPDHDPTVGKFDINRVAPHVGRLPGRFAREKGIGVQLQIIDEVHCRRECLGADEYPKPALLVEMVAFDERMPDWTIQLIVAAPV